MTEHADPQRIQAALAEHPDVDQALVISNQEDSMRGENLWLAYVVAKGELAKQAGGRELKFSLFYFADANAALAEDKYKLYLQGATFADEHEFEAVWTPERHFHENGGLYPNPSVLSAALATITRRIKLRSGSVVLPLHHSLRVAEEWSVVDNLSKGRVGISFTSGWVPNDFAISPRPESYRHKREAMLEQIEQVQQLWQGHTIWTKDGVGNDVELRIFPQPIQTRLPIWLTCSGDPAMFEKAGEMGFNVLTALLTQSLDETAEKISKYRKALIKHGHDPESRCVTMMLHTYVDDDEEEVREIVRQPMIDYLKSHIGLVNMMAKSLNIRANNADPNDPVWLDYAASFGFERYYQTGSLLGTPERCLSVIQSLKQMGVDEVACLIDFGVDSDLVLRNLSKLNELKDQSNREINETSATLRAFLKERLNDDARGLSFRFVERLPESSLPSVGQPYQPDLLTTIISPSEPEHKAAGAAAPFAAQKSRSINTIEERVRMQKTFTGRRNQLRERENS
jgi:natural product biosynthesis luciferase-like monooxygenase protein